MLTRIDLEAASRRALDALQRAGCDAAEVYAARPSTLALELHYGRLSRPLYAGEQGVRVRWAANGTVNQLASERCVHLDPDDLVDVLVGGDAAPEVPGQRGYVASDLMRGPHFHDVTDPSPLQDLQGVQVSP